MENIRSILYDTLKNSSKGSNEQYGYIYVPDFKIESTLSEPYKSNYYCIGFQKRGKLILDTNLISHQIDGPALVFADPTTIKRWQETNEVYEAESILLSEAYLLDRLLENYIFASFSDMTDSGAFVGRLVPDEAANVQALFNIIRYYSTRSGNNYHKEVVRGTVYSLISHIAALYQSGKSEVKPNSRLDWQFRKAVSEYGGRQRGVNFYADLLNVHPKYLSQVITAETGRTASEWIQRQVILEAKIFLQNHTLTINNIADVLHFPDQSTFSKYFKKYAGTSPNSYRNYIMNALK